MRKLVAASVLALAVIVSPACKEPDPNKFETHIERIKDADKRPQGFSGLETLVKTVASAQENEDLLQEFADKVVPVFEEVWDEAKEQRPKMLQLCLDIGHPGCAPIWNRAIALDGSSEAREATLLALEGVRKAKADGSIEPIIEQLDKLVTDPKNDGGDRPGEVRGLMVDTLGELGSPKALPVLIKSLEQTVDKQPVGVHRKVATAMGRIGDPSAIDALLTAVYRVPDAPTTTNIAEKVKVAIGSIGEAAIPRVIAMLKGEHEEVQKLAATNSVDQVNIQLYAASLLGVIGSSKGAADLIAYMPVAECAPDAEQAKGEEEAPVVDTAKIRAQLGNSLGFIADASATESVCACSTWSKNPGDMFALAESLGRIGGADAAKCLENVIRTGVYDQDAVENSSFIHEIQWEAARFGVLSADADTIGSIKAAIEASAAADPKVKENTAAWATGIQTIEKCGKDKGCYMGVLDDSNADWFAREVAAVNVARMSEGDIKAAQALAKAYKVRNPDARVTMAWLASHVMQGKPCGECVETFERIMADEKDSRLPAKYQLSVLTARYSIGKLRPKGGAK